LPPRLSRFSEPATMTRTRAVVVDGESDRVPSLPERLGDCSDRHTIGVSGLGFFVPEGAHSAASRSTGA
jgi:hypothetical protein